MVYVDEMDEEDRSQKSRPEREVVAGFLGRRLLARKTGTAGSPAGTPALI
jgi:hypothetical protein